jgi:DNA (cytosine-5)-methyltransferase 1
MTQRKKLLDLYCGAGGVSKGYSNAGWDVSGVDIESQLHYPFEFYRADALDFLSRHGDRFDAFHASPPCGPHTILRNQGHVQNTDVDYLHAVRDALIATGKPYIIENVVGAPLRQPVTLCGTMFGLGVDVEGEWWDLRRHRDFESNVLLSRPVACQHRSRRVVTVTGKPGGRSNRRDHRLASFADWQTSMQIDWMSTRELAQAIPPAFTEHLGHQLAHGTT